MARRLRMSYAEPIPPKDYFIDMGQRDGLKVGDVLEVFVGAGGVAGSPSDGTAGAGGNGADSAATSGTVIAGSNGGSGYARVTYWS